VVVFYVNSAEWHGLNRAQNRVSVSDGLRTVGGSEFHIVMSSVFCFGAKYYKISVHCRTEMTATDRCRHRGARLGEVARCGR